MARVTPNEASRGYKIILALGWLGVPVGLVAGFLPGVILGIIMLALTYNYQYRQADRVVGGRLPGTGRLWPWEDRQWIRNVRSRARRGRKK